MKWRKFRQYLLAICIILGTLALVGLSIFFLLLTFGEESDNARWLTAIMAIAFLGAAILSGLSAIATWVRAGDP